MTTTEEYSFQRKLTGRMLRKSIIDVTKPMEEWYWFALDGNFGDMLSMEHDEHSAVFVSDDGEMQETTLKFYRRGRGDKLFWIKGLRKFAKEGDTIEVWTDSDRDMKSPDAILISVVKTEEEQDN